MRKEPLFVLLLLLTVCSSCKREQPKKQSHVSAKKVAVAKPKTGLSKADEQLIRDYYSIEDEEGTIVQPNNLQVIYTDLAVRLISEELAKSSYKPVPKHVAYERIRQIFGVDMQASPEELVKNGFWIYAQPGEDKKIRQLQKRLMALKTLPNGNQEYGKFWDLNIFLPQYNCLIFPYLGAVVTIKGTIKGADGEEYMDTKNGKIVRALDKTMIYRNQFIFHGSLSALKWLKENDEGFLWYLFASCGYDKSDIINKMAVDRVMGRCSFPMAQDCRDLFASRGPNGQLLIHEGLLKYMLKHATKKNEYYRLADAFLLSLLDMEEEPEFYGFTKEERYRIGAYVGYYYGLMYDKGVNTPIDRQGFGRALYYDEDFMSFLIKNKYFHLKNFEEIMRKQYARFSESIDIEERQPEE